MIIFVLIFIVSVTFYMHFRHTRKHLYKVCDSLPNIGSLPVIGHMHWFVGGPEKILGNIKQLTELIEEEGGTSQLWIGPHLYIVTYNLDDIRMIMENCLQKDSSYKFLKTWLGNGLFVAPVSLWRHHRRILLPIFHRRLINDSVDIFGEQARVLAQRLQAHTGQQLDIYPYITSCMLDIVFESAMGQRMGVQNNVDVPYVRARDSIMEIINMRMFKAWLQPEALFKLTSYFKKQQDAIAFTHQFTENVIKKKRFIKESGEIQDEASQKDLLDQLMESKQFTDEELRENIDSITLAGNDTTALVVSYALVLLGHHPEHQQNVYDEVHGIFGDSDRLADRDDLQKMEYLDRVIKETLRLYTVVPILARETDKELKLSNCTLPAGVGCAIPLFTLHRSKRLWGPTANEFDPDRFLPERSEGRHPCAYIPFSYGSRNCIGRQFGVYAVKCLVSTLLRNFKVKSEPIDRFKIQILLCPLNGHMITLEKRDC